jgi:hypothetical protein
MRTALINSVMFNVSWLAIILSQSNPIALGIAIVHVAVHLYIMGLGRWEWILLAIVFALGLVMDQLLFLSGVLNVAGEPGLAPVWLSCLWLVLATTLMHAFAPLQNKLWLAAMVGVVGGTGSYIAGTRLSDIDFGWPLLSPALIGLLWLFLLPALLVLARSLQKNTGIDLC